MISYAIAKTVIDYVVAVILLLPFSVFLVIYSLFTIVFHGSSPLIIQERMLGLGGKKIEIFKLRTMKQKTELFYGGEHSFKKLAVLNPYITFGKFIRRAGIDEFPQLIHVLSGKMSLIGLRPLLEKDLKRLKVYDPNFSDWRSSLEFKPGISGLWQLERSSELSFEELSKLDKIYLQRRTILFELGLLFKTALRLFTIRHTDNISISKIG